ncbi:MAG: glycosyltransferase family 2 protein [Magnetococcales bacterium]|nr:glycosyltransferase family 2 protein [Magnetococcales bacterium]
MTEDEQSCLKVIVVVPAFNEGEIIGETIASLRQLSEEFAEEGYRFAVYVVDDGSTDNTREQAEAAGADRVVRHRHNMGLGAAVRSGLQAARKDKADIVIKFDADFQHDPKDIPVLVRTLVEDELDVVYGARFDRIEYRMPPVRRLGNLVFTTLMRWLTGWPLRDSQPGIFAISRNYLEVFYLPGDYNYTQQILMDSYRKGMRFAHVPVTFRQRSTGRSFVSLRYPFKVLPQIFMVLVAVRPMKVFAPIGMTFLLTGAGLLFWELGQWFMGDYPKPVQHVNLVMGLILFGIQTLFFGVLAHLIVEFKGKE